MAAGRYGGYHGYGSYDSRFYSDYDAYGSGGGGGFVNHEYHDSSYGGGGYWGHESQKGDAGDYDDPATKKRKLSNLTICVDHLRGYCAKGARCPKAHVDYVESIDEREVMAKVKFCHDFQNKGVCTRQNCRFLHVTRREEDEFLLTGQIPPTVFDRKNDYGEEGDYGGGYSGAEPSHSYRPRGSFPARPRGGGGGGRSGPPGWHGGGGGWPRGPPPPSREDPYLYNRRWEEHHHPPPQFEVTKEGHPSSQPVTYSNYCIDYLKGTCSKGDKCQLQHVQMVESREDREAISKSVFCHDFLNWKCPRPFCKYIHATNEEQKLFVEHGYFSPVLCQRNKDKLFYSDICIDHLRKQCIRGENCQYRHVVFVEEREERICLSRSIFCHDHQEGRCERFNCKLIHTGKNDEAYFLRTGSLPDHLRVGGSSAEFDPSLESLASSVCREFVKNRCTRGATCKFYHPPADELARIVDYQRSKGTTGDTHSGAVGDAGPSSEEISRLQQENKELKERAHQLERLLADACHCITLAVGDQNPAIQTLMQTIATMAPESSLARGPQEDGQKTTEDESGLAIQEGGEQQPGATTVGEVRIKTE